MESVRIVDRVSLAPWDYRSWHLVCWYILQKYAIFIEVIGFIIQRKATAVPILHLAFGLMTISNKISQVQMW